MADGPGAVRLLPLIVVHWLADVFAALSPVLLAQG